MTPHDHVIFTDLDGTEGVLVDLETKPYLQLNETACVVWRELANGTPPIEIARAMTARDDVTLEHARASVDTALVARAAHHLVHAT